MNADDSALIQRSRDGDPRAFEGLVRRYQDRLYGSLVHLLGSTHDALDVAQETFLLAYQNLSSFRGNSAFYSWLFRIAYNAAISYRRRQKRPLPSLDLAREQNGFDPRDHRSAVDPAHDMIAEERRQLVHSALAELADEFREVLVLKELEGLPYEEIAEIVGCPIGTVRSRIHRARSELREKLAKGIKSGTL